MNQRADCNPVIYRIEMCISGRLLSPILPGSGQDMESNMDIVKDQNGRPWLWGTSLAGVLRNFLENEMGKSAADRVFGSGTYGNQEGRQSRLFVYDTEFEEENVVIRDGVRLDEWKNSQDTKKYDMQIIERGSRFNIYLTLSVRKNDNKEEMEKALSCLISGMRDGQIRIGARKNRGFGKLGVKDVYQKQFRMDDREEAERWLNWERRSADSFTKSDMLKDTGEKRKNYAKEHCLETELIVDRTLLIRSYDLDSEADYCQLVSRGQAVIPGTAWAGAIRGRIASVIQEIYKKSWDEAQCALDAVFGTWNETNESLTASKVLIEESVVEGGHELLTSRNAVDRVSGGVKRGALWTEIIWIGGKTRLQLFWPTGDENSDAVCGLLLWALRDIREGFLAVGGETAAGRGCFKGTGEILLDGEKLPEEKQKKYFLEAAGWCREVKAGEGKSCN